MVKKTFFKIMSFGLGIVLITGFLTVCVYYKSYENQAENELESVAHVAASQLNATDCENYDYIEQTDDSNIRLTLIKSDGTVLVDSKENAEELENHSDRPEFAEALRNGESSVIRNSETLGENTYYYAILLDSNNVLRVSVTGQSVYVMFYKALIVNIAVIALVMLISLAMSYAITKSIIRPVTQLGENLEKIDSVKTYDELQPFVKMVKKQQEKKKLLDKQKKEFTANVSHELKTPLTSIAGYAELIENGMAKSEDIAPFAHTIHKQALRLVSLSEDIIKLNQIEETENRFVFEKTDLAEICKKCLNELGVNAKAKNITLNYSGAESCFVMGNRSLLDELVYNLCDNAIRYNKPGGSVTVSAEPTDCGAVLTVSDTGIGIPEKYQKRVFERFFRVDKSRSKETGGTGLGLAIVKHITEVHCAELTVDSAPEMGTTMRIEFSNDKISPEN